MNNSKEESTKSTQKQGRAKTKKNLSTPLPRQPEKPLINKSKGSMPEI